MVVFIYATALQETHLTLTFKWRNNTKSTSLPVWVNAGIEINMPNYHSRFTGLTGIKYRRDAEISALRVFDKFNVAGLSALREYDKERQADISALRGKRVKEIMLKKSI